MRIAQVTFIYSEQQDSIYKEVGLGADIVEVLEDGYINLDDVSACSAFYGNTIIFLKGGHSFTIDMNFNNFVSIWKK
jgi:hypothetical protein